MSCRAGSHRQSILPHHTSRKCIVWLWSTTARQASVEKDSLAHADTKDGDLAGKVLDGIAADAGIGARVSGTGADDQLRWVLCNQLVESDLVVSVDGDLGPF